MSNDPINDYILGLVLDDIKKRLTKNPVIFEAQPEEHSEPASDSSSDSEDDKIEREKERRRAYWLANRDEINRRRRMRRKQMKKIRKN